MNSTSRKTNQSGLQPHLRRAGMGLQAFAVGQHRSNAAQGLGTGFRYVDQAGALLGGVGTGFSDAPSPCGT